MWQIRIIWSARSGVDNHPSARHPSLVIWCSGNDIQQLVGHGRPVALRLLNKLCFELITNAPSSGISLNRNGARRIHLLTKAGEEYGVFQNPQHYAHEFGVPSAAGVNELKKIIPENELFDYKDKELGEASRFQPGL